VALLHEVVEDTRRGVDDVRGAFGDEVAEMVDALTEDDAVTHYFPRKRALRVASAGSPVVDVALADKIATLRHAVITGTRVTPASSRTRRGRRFRAQPRRGRAVPPSFHGPETCTGHGSSPGLACVSPLRR
jgi:hypothetical protein